MTLFFLPISSLSYKSVETQTCNVYKKTLFTPGTVMVMYNSCIMKTGLFLRYYPYGLLIVGWYSKHSSPVVARADRNNR